MMYLYLQTGNRVRILLADSLQFYFALIQGFLKKGILKQMGITPLKSIRNEKSWGVLEFWKIKFTINAA